MTDEGRSADERAIEYLERGKADLEPVVAADLDVVRAELAEAATWEEPRPGLEDDIVAMLLAQPVPADADRSAVPPPVAPVPSVTNSPSVVALADARARRSRTVAVVASIVAAAAVVVAIVGFASRPAANVESATGSTGTTTAPPSERRTIGPGVEATLNATDLMPGAAGTVRLDETDSGVWIRLDASGLPRRDNGAFYQAWVKTPQGLVPIGTFHTGDDVVLWSGIPIADTDAVTVTLEENDGNQDSSGKRVLLATIPHTGGTVPPATAPTATAPR